MKVITAAQAAALIKDGDTVATGGFVGIGFAKIARSRSKRGFSNRARRAT